MTKFKLLGVFFLACLLTLSRSNASELGHVTIVNGSYGGGWELTAQVTGETLVDLGLADSFTIKTLEGGAGSRALDMFLSEDQYKNSILVQSEPLISGFLKRSYQKGFRDLRPVALMAAEYTCLLVPNNAPYQNADDVLNVIKKNPASIPISLGGRYGTGDHIIANMIFKAGNVSNPTELRYIFSDGGDKATIRYLTTTRYVVGISGYNSIISEASKNKEIRVIGLTSEDSIDGHPTLREQGINIGYANWRGFFARKDMPDAKFVQYLEALRTLSESPEWRRILHKNNWSPFFKSGPVLDQFLIRHEANLKTTMQELRIIQ